LSLDVLSIYQNDDLCTGSRFFTLGCFHELTPYGPLIHTQKYFQDRFRIRGDIHIPESALSDTALIPNQCCRLQR
jgi:hypothetical protein